MVDEIHHDDETGAVLYATLESTSSGDAGKLWNTNSSAFETRTVANWSTNHYYDIALTETPASSYHYVGTMPAVPAGFYWLNFYVRAGASSLISDVLLLRRLVYWNSTALAPADTNPAAASGTASALAYLLAEMCAVEAFGTASVAGSDANGPYRFHGFYNELPYFINITHSNLYLWWSGVQWRISAALGETTNYLYYEPQGHEITYEAFVAEGTATGSVVFYVNPYIGQSSVSGGTVLTDILPGNANALAQAATALSNATWTDEKAGYLDASVSGRATPADVLAQAGGALAAYNTTGVAKEASIGAIATILTGITSLAAWLRGLFRKDAINATALSEINAIHDGGAAGTFSATTDSNEALADTLATPADVGTQLTSYGAAKTSDVTGAHSTTDGKIDNAQADVTTILARIGAWTGTGINTILGAFKALLSKAASAPSDIGGTFGPTTDSTEAIRERLDTSLDGGGSEIFTTDPLQTPGGDPVSNASSWVTTDEAGLYVKANAMTDETGTATFHLNPGTYYLWFYKLGGNTDGPYEITVPEA